MGEYVSVKIPWQLRERFERIKDKHGYRTFAEFVIESIRLRLEQLEGEKE